MMTVRETPLAFIRSSSVSGVASRSGHARAFGEREGGVVLPHVDVGIDDARIGGQRGSAAAPASSVRRVTDRSQT